MNMRSHRVERESLLQRAKENHEQSIALVAEEEGITKYSMHHLAPILATQATVLDLEGKGRLAESSRKMADAIFCNELNDVTIDTAPLTKEELTVLGAVTTDLQDRIFRQLQEAQNASLFFQESDEEGHDFNARHAVDEELRQCRLRYLSSVEVGSRIWKRQFPESFN